MDSDQNTNTNSGLLLYRGGTVCDDSFDQNAADALCSVLGFPGVNSGYTSGGPVLEDFRAGRRITLDDVTCGSSDWDDCTYSTTHNCAHSEDVFLQCGGKVSIFGLPPINLKSITP